MNDYERSIQAIRDLDKKPSKQEWNHLAMKYNFLTTYSLSIISNMSFTKLVQEVRKKN